MNNDDFFTTNSIAKLMTKKKSNDEGENVVWRNIRWIKIEKDEPSVMRYKYRLKESMPFERVNFEKRMKRWRPQNWPTTLCCL